ncbi:hypothetical protein MIU24_32105 [Streptomyces venezuelae]|uniref:hypothetical protein n=1 Tax=Streptomyces sp. B6(2022) TaxID=3404749 RepID=UPI00311ECC64
MTAPPYRPPLRASLAALALAGVILAGAPAAFAAPGDSAHGGPPHGQVGTVGGGAEIASDDSSRFGIASAAAAGLAGTTGLVLIRRSRRRDDGSA